ncbi:DUF1993 domain-containing protein [Sphingomonadaceae bacterium jetA1]|jgi:hypothetical protein|uniref:DUF1993 domain-containing protein n=1 Tax=Facivitalis istanbulensis TaxID=3075838 RepID=UPI00347F9518
MLLTGLLIPTYRQMLQTLDGLLGKAEEHGSKQTRNLLDARLDDDMLPLSSQIRFAVYQAQDAVFRLRDEAIPQWLTMIAAEGHEARSAAGSWDQVRRYIADAQSFLATLPGDALDPAASRPITITLPDGMTFDLTGEQYVRDWALPQFYFHVVTAYAILRHHGVRLGKADYVPHMFAYLRKGDAPAA